MKSVFTVAILLCAVGCEPANRIDANGKQVRVLGGTERFGYEARMAGAHAEANPYQHLNVPAAERWLQGWIEASNELKQGEATLTEDAE